MIDFTKIPKDLKSVLINVIILPFWIVSIYIFEQDIYKSNDYLIISALCISLTIISSFLTSLIFIINNNNHYFLSEKVVIPSVAIQVFLISGVIFIGYLFKVLLNIEFLFYGFLSTYFGIIIIFNLLLLIPGKKEIKKS
jgi:hypothetical protein